MTDAKPKKKKAAKAVGVGRLKKVTSKKPKGVHPYKVRFGTRNEFTEVRTYPTAPKAKQAVVKELKAWQPWCIRYNQDGLIAIEDALILTDAMVFHTTRDRIECCFDEHTNMWLVAEYWLDETPSHP
jgi:hypothetical protein